MMDRFEMMTSNSEQVVNGAVDAEKSLELGGAVARIKRGRESSRIRNPRSRHDGVGLRPTELRHPVEDVTPDRGLSHLRVAIPRLQASSEH